jgi:hypothetical protein
MLAIAMLVSTIILIICAVGVFANGKKGWYLGTCFVGSMSLIVIMFLAGFQPIETLDVNSGVLSFLILFATINTAALILSTQYLVKNR